MKQVDIYSLKVGDKFVEDTFPEVYEVVGFKQDFEGNLVIAKDLSNNEEVGFGYTCQAYAPTIFFLEDEDLKFLNLEVPL